jgi:hypothetical protein
VGSGDGEGDGSAAGFAGGVSLATGIGVVIVSTIPAGFVTSLEGLVSSHPASAVASIGNAISIAMVCRLTAFTVRSPDPA